MNKYKLHSKAKDNSWFHFREDMNSLMQSFTISYLWDGSVVLSGDMGDLMWKRHSHGYGNRLDYGFPNKETNEVYFAEKVLLPNELKDWDFERADKEIREILADEGYEELKAKYEKEVEQYYNIPETHEQFINLLNEIGFDDGYDIGEDWSSWFLYQLKMIASVSDIIVEEVNKTEN